MLEIIQDKLKGYKFIVVSNRQPYAHTRKGNEIQCNKTVSGLTIALDPVMQAVGGVWIAWASGDADMDVVDENNCVKVPPQKPSYTLKRVVLSKKEVDGFYYGYANQALWPLSHIVYEKPVFLKEHWECYKEINKRFAQNIIDEIGDEKAFIWLQDYHFTLAAKYIKERKPDATVALFWHIPWPNPEAFRICPQKTDILEGLLSCDLLGFHIRYHCSNFLETVDSELEARVSREECNVVYHGHKTLIKDFPISVDFGGLSEQAKSKEVEIRIQKLSEEIPPPFEILAIGVDRIDYTKGILERLHAVDRFLEKYPQYHKKFVFYQAGALSRIHIPAYKELNDKVEESVEKINWKYREGNWYPIVVTNKILSYAEHLALYRRADLCLVSSLHDGMNLVAKEFVSANVEGKGVLVLSQFTGAARELSKGAVLINPYDFDSTSDAIKEAIEMPSQEKKERMQTLREIVAENDIYKWVERFISYTDKL